VHVPQQRSKESTKHPLTLLLLMLLFYFLFYLFYRISYRFSAHSTYKESPKTRGEANQNKYGMIYMATKTQNPINHQNKCGIIYNMRFSPSLCFFSSRSSICLGGGGGRPPAPKKSPAHFVFGLCLFLHLFFT
jgi:hypothetical protein